MKLLDWSLTTLYLARQRRYKIMAYIALSVPTPVLLFSDTNFCCKYIEIFIILKIHLYRRCISNVNPICPAAYFSISIIQQLTFRWLERPPTQLTCEFPVCLTNFLDALESLDLKLSVTESVILFQIFK